MLEVSPYPEGVELETKKMARVKDYELIIEYHLGMANMVVDALSQKSSATLTYIRIAYVPLLVDMKALRINLDYDDSGALLANFVVRPSLVDQIRVSQMQDEKLVKEV